MASTTEKFIGLYREYEQLLRASGLDPKTVEDAAANLDSDRLRLCRQFRNYFAHVQDPGFLEATDKMMRYLEGKVRELKLAGDVVKKHIKKPDTCILSESDKVQVASERFQKLKCFSLIVLKADGAYGSLSVFDILGQRGTAKINTLKIKGIKPKFCGPLDDFASLDPEQVYLCTDSGVSDGKLLGQVWR